MAFPIAAFVTSYIYTKKPIKNEAANASVALILGLAIIYTLGFLYLSWAAHMTLKKAFSAGVLPFIIPDIIKLIIAYFLARVIKSRKVLNIS